LGIEVAVVNQRAHGRELPYTFIFRYALAGYLVALRWMAVAGAKNVKPEKSRNDIVDAPTLFSKEILKASKGHLALCLRVVCKSQPICVKGSWEAQLMLE
jgi:hypothetical protein